MAQAGGESVTQLLLRWRAGDRECLNRLIPLVDAELRCIAHRYMRMDEYRFGLERDGLNPSYPARVSI